MYSGINDENFEDIKFEIFKKILNDPNGDELLKEYVSESNVTKSQLKELFSIFIISKMAYSNYIENMENNEKFNICNEKYNEILKKTSILAQELKLNNFIEYSNLFTYLLWNGYFSKDRKLTFKIENRLMVFNGLSFDIMNGHGVCLNFSAMLKDFLNFNNFDSAVMVNSLNEDIKRNYDIDLERPISKQKLLSKLFEKTMYPISKKVGNHATVLINDKTVIYDPTNLLMLNIIDKNNAEVIEGEGKIKLNPYFSYLLNNSKESIKVLDNLQKSKDFEHQTINNFSNLRFDNITKFSDNERIINNFHDDIEDNILTISREAKKIKR